MREIKFRAWEVNKTLGGRMSEPFTVFDIHNRVVGLGTYGDTYTLMQYTGLKDKNGVEIYEGDRIKNDEGETQVVDYDVEVVTNCGCCNSVKVVGYDFSDFANPNYCEVIGNIYEHKHLLE